MRTYALFTVALLVVGCTSAPAPDEATGKLVDQHTEIWKLMKLSDAAQAELNAIVLQVNINMQKNRKEHPEWFAREPKRAKQPTHDEYMAAHKKRFDMLKISDGTQKELLAAAEFVWKALHDPNVPEQDRAVATKIKEMMTKLQGPPPCCDDNIFEKASN